MLKDGVLLLLNRFVGMFIPIIMVPLIIRKLGAEEYGQFVFYQSIAFVLAVFLLLGSDTKGIKDLSDRIDEEDILNHYSSQISSQLLSAMLIMVIAIVIAFLTSESLFIFIVLLSLKEVFYSTYFHIVISKILRLTIIDLTLKTIIFFLILYDFFISAEKIIRFSGILYCLSGLMYAIFYLNVRIKLSLNEFKKHFTKYQYMFLQKIFSTIKDRFANAYIPFIMSFDMLAYYDIALKFISIGVLPGNVYNQISLKNGKKSFIEPLILSCIMSIILVFFMKIFCVEISNYLRMELFIFENLIYLIGLGVFSLSITSIIGLEGLLKSGLDRSFFRSTFIAGIVYIISLILSGSLFEPSVTLFLVILISSYFLEFVSRIILYFK